ncbi:unnamed protein product [Acanthoscelides obtectus]|uniref:Uncharacterized protein n=1 Tax=Acanthoscelides obtectus TaxID=200917 RepID=A0A9P0Q0P1_ACAOB|nr:unnamed protein product [Acanthoscelides obtectus]CAK1674235.1 hypothetical protein AOBTE_LOCUS29561 [Acanthoscelides obtectus]
MYSSIIVIYYTTSS